MNITCSVAVLTLSAGLIASQAATASDEEIFQSCKAELKFSDSACQCVLDKVESELTPEQKEMLSCLKHRNSVKTSNHMSNQST